MFVDKVRIGATTVAMAARLGVVVVVACGLVGVVAGIVRVVRSGKMTEGMVVVIASTMTTVVSAVLMLFIAWRVEAAGTVSTTFDPDAADRAQEARARHTGTAVPTTAPVEPIR